MSDCPHPRRGGNHNVYVRADRLHCKSCGEDLGLTKLGQLEALRVAAQALVDRFKDEGSLDWNGPELAALETALKAVGS